MLRSERVLIKVAFARHRLAGHILPPRAGVLHVRPQDQPGRAAAEDQRNIACLFRGIFLLPDDLHRASSAGRWRQKYSHAVHSRVTLAHTHDSTLARRSRLPHLFANQSHRQSGCWTPTTMFSAATQVTQLFSG